MVYGAFLFLMMAGWSFGTTQTQNAFIDTDVALENAIAGSNGDCFQAMRRCDGEITVWTCITSQTAERCRRFYCYWC